MTSEDPDALVERAQQMLTDGETIDAVKLLDQIIDKFPEFSDAYDARALGKMQLGKYDAALDDLNSFGKLSGDDPAYFAHFGEVLRNVRRYDEALESAAKALEFDPEFPDARYLRGWLFFYCGQYGEAEDDFAFYADNAEDAGEVTDLLAVCRKINREKLRDSACENELRRSGFSLNTQYNDNYEAEEMACPYAHCIRSQASRSDDADDCCDMTGFACPGGSSQAAQCRGDVI